MALLRGKLLGGALFAGALFGATLAEVPTTARREVVRLKSRITQVVSLESAR